MLILSYGYLFVMALIRFILPDSIKDVEIVGDPLQGVSQLKLKAFLTYSSSSRLALEINTTHTHTEILREKLQENK